MSDFIDESDASDQSGPTDPFRATTADAGGESIAEAELNDLPDATSLNEDAAAVAATSMFTSGLETPGEPILSDDPPATASTEASAPSEAPTDWSTPVTTASDQPALDSASAEPAAAESHSPVSPYAMEMSPPLDPAVDPPATSAPHFASPPIGRAVRPLEPYMTESPSLLDDPTPRREPTRPYYAAKVEEEKSPRQWPTALLALASGLLGALLVLGGLAVGGVFDDEPAPTSTTAAPAAAVTAPPETVIVREVIAPEGSAAVATAVGQKVVPSIVTIEVGTGDPVSDFAAFGSGSGVVFTDDGLILTNHHVVDGAESSRVIFQDGRIYAATIMGSDELTDLAVLEIQAAGLMPIELGSTTQLQIGDRAIAVGNPLGLEGGASLTVGVVSAFDREVNTGDATPLFGMLQTDAPITNGSSGGALVDSEGKLIGITTAIGVSESGAEGIGFATPVEVVQRIANQIIATGDVAHAFLGVSLQTNFRIQTDGAAVPTGAVVAGFADADSAAQAAGLELDDVIVSWNGNDVRTINDLINGIRAAMVGDAIDLVVDRNGETFSFTVILGQRPEGV
ncbi:MAG: trypsin-like serine protease [Acidimicrobiia bacterium]|nr:trypsin-like serine protease [Acidimicrobiia bacterium]